MVEIFGSIENAMTAALAGAILALVSATAAVVQTWQGRRAIQVAMTSFIADHERRKKQATLEHITGIRETYIPIRQKLDQVFGVDGAVRLDMLDADHELRADLTKFLVTFEHLAVGALTDVFDRDVLLRSSGAFITTAYERVEPYVQRIRIDRANERLYVEFETLAREFKALRNAGIAPDLGRIR